jgi:predicted enzyme related to lactoylglutathione lyase
MRRVVNFEIHSTDPEAMASFYSSLFGWTITKWDGPMDYWMITTGSDEEPGINGGLIRRHGEAPAKQPVNAFVCTIDVESAESSLARAVELGAEVALARMAVPGIGWLCYAKDPDGNVFGMMQPDPTAA